MIIKKKIEAGDYVIINKSPDEQYMDFMSSGNERRLMLLKDAIKNKYIFKVDGVSARFKVARIEINGHFFVINTDYLSVTRIVNNKNYNLF